MNRYVCKQGIANPWISTKPWLQASGTPSLQAVLVSALTGHMEGNALRMPGQSQGFDVTSTARAGWQGHAGGGDLRQGHQLRDDRGGGARAPGALLRDHQRHAEAWRPRRHPGATPWSQSLGYFVLLLLLSLQPNSNKVCSARPTCCQQALLGALEPQGYGSTTAHQRTFIYMLICSSRTLCAKYLTTVWIPNGKAAAPLMQVITEPDERYEEYCASSDFIREHIFPGGHLPSMGAMVEAARPTQLQARSQGSPAMPHTMTG